MTDAPIELVRRFCAAWAGGDLDELMTYFADDAVYHNIPLDPVTGKEQIRATIEGFTGSTDKIEFRVVHVLAEGPIVMTERVDVFMTGDRAIEVPVMGSFEVRGGKIAAWRDYFDLNQFMSQLQGS